MEALPADLPAALRARADAGAAWVREQGAAGRTVTVVHHIDADGVSAGAIACEALHRAGVAHRPLAVKSLDELHVGLVRQSGAHALWFCDLGSTVATRFQDTPRLVCDHHQLVRDGLEESFPHVNPLLDGLSGEEVSGAGCAYLVAGALAPSNLDLLPLALVGASADLQDRPKGGAPGDRAGPTGLRGANAALLRHGAQAGVVEVRTELAWYGLGTRPLQKLLHLAREPDVPGVTGDRRSAEAFLAQLGLDPKAFWADLTDGQRTQVRAALVDRLLDAGLPERAQRLFRPVLAFPREPVGSPLREPQECATLLNGTARYGRPEVGLAVARGDRGAAYEEALSLLRDHRKHLGGALEAFSAAGTSQLLGIQWIHLEDRVLDTVVGTVCGMALEQAGIPQDLVLVGLAWTPDGQTKASGRLSRTLQGRVDLAPAMREAAAEVGGQGGGHAGAAGATMPRTAEQQFIRALDRRIAAQLGRGSPVASPGPGGWVPVPTPGHPTQAIGAPAALPARPARGSSGTREMPLSAFGGKREA